MDMVDTKIVDGKIQVQKSYPPFSKTVEPFVSVSPSVSKKGLTIVMPKAAEIILNQIESPTNTRFPSRLKAKKAVDSPANERGNRTFTDHKDSLLLP